jgi:murein DD-endopeptidase MepM/ murein hydrolase activator NlpD
MKENQSHISPEGGQPSSSAGKVNERYPYGTHYDSATSPNAQNMRETNPSMPLESDNVQVDLSTDPLSGLDEQNDTGSCTGAEFGGYSRYSNGYTGHPEEIKAKNSIFPEQNADAKPAPRKEDRKQRLGVFVAAAVSAAAIGAVGWLSSAELPIGSDAEPEEAPSLTAEVSSSAEEDTQVSAAQENIPKTENFVITYESAESEETPETLSAESTADEQETAAAEEPEESLPEVTETGSASVSTPSTPDSFVLPVGESGAVSQPFSCGELVKSKTLGEWRTHDGIDFAAKEGDSVVSIADGLVESVTQDARWGNTVVVNYGDYTAYYYGLADQIAVQAGNSVTAGQALGQIGNSSLIEASETPHLHLGIKKDGSWIDPALLLGLDDGDPADTASDTDAD